MYFVLKVKNLFIVVFILNFHINLFADVANESPLHPMRAVILEIPVSVCKRVIYHNRDTHETGRVVPYDNSYYKLYSAWDDTQKVLGGMFDYDCINYGKSPAFTFVNVEGKWQYVNVLTRYSDRIMDGRADLTVDGVKVPCGNGDETKHYWRVYWLSSYPSMAYGTEQCPQTQVACMSQSSAYSPVNDSSICEDGFSTPKGNIQVAAGWGLIKLWARESQHRSHSYFTRDIDTTVTYIDGTPHPELGDSKAIVMSAQPEDNKLYDKKGNVVNQTGVSSNSSSNGAWYRLAMPNNSTQVKLNIHIGMSEKARDLILDDGTYTCVAKFNSDDLSSPEIVTIIKNAKSNLTDTLKGYDDYAFYKQFSKSFDLRNKKTIKATMSITCQNSSHTSPIEFDSQSITLYKIKHF